ncbi:MAG TPA: hypothetical protein PL105_26985, partial [Caldilineaceae bacterium]|nr:hypothetical protein [Caldilineaceae bacterium]
SSSVRNSGSLGILIFYSPIQLSLSIPAFLNRRHISGCDYTYAITSLRRKDDYQKTSLIRLSVSQILSFAAPLQPGSIGNYFFRFVGFNAVICNVLNVIVVPPKFIFRHRHLTLCIRISETDYTIGIFALCYNGF